MTLGDLLAAQNAMLIAALVLAAMWEGWRPHRPFAQSRDRWVHIGRNLGFGLVSIVIASLLLGQLGLKLQLWGEASGLGILSLVPLPAWVVVVIGLLVADLSDYFFHRFCHEWRALWLLHSVHHSDPQLDVSTFLRTHPGQMLFGIAWRLLVAFAIGIPVWVVVLRDLLALGIAVLHHANISWPGRIDAGLRKFDRHAGHAQAPSFAGACGEQQQFRVAAFDLGSGLRHLSRTRRGCCARVWTAQPRDTTRPVGDRDAAYAVAGAPVSRAVGSGPGRVVRSSGGAGGAA
jgi:sterol desaturase/sphingolipid hydroxylase (fatty acid hydroxylase superfamily)